MIRGSEIVITHHWLVSQRGGENVLAEVIREFPGADLVTLVTIQDKDQLDPIFKTLKITNSIISKLPKAEKIYKHLLPFYPLVINSIQLDSKYKLVISSDANMIKGIRRPKMSKHICYCHSPPRYIWDLTEEYMRSMNFLTRHVFKFVVPWLRKFDLKASKNVDHFIANSLFVKERIKRVYNRESIVIYPPVDLIDFKMSDISDEYYLIVSALVPYKRVDIAVDAFSKNGLNLVIIGSGSELDKLKLKATDNIKFLGKQPKEVLINYYQRCKAFIFAGVEDFGITPLEAQACGKPVIAYREGGALETVIPNVTGIFFDSQTPESLNHAIRELDYIDIKAQDCRNSAERFSPENFRRQLRNYIHNKLK